MKSWAMHNHLGVLKPQGGIAYAKASVRELMMKFSFPVCHAMLRVNDVPLNMGRLVNNVKLGGGFKHFWNFHPEYWGRFPIWRAYFSDGLKPPTRKSSQVPNLTVLDLFSDSRFGHACEPYWRYSEMTGVGISVLVARMANGSKSTMKELMSVYNVYVCIAYSFYVCYRVSKIVVPPKNSRGNLLLCRFCHYFEWSLP